MKNFPHVGCWLARSVATAYWLKTRFVFLCVYCSEFLCVDVHINPSFTLPEIFGFIIG